MSSSRPRILVDALAVSNGGGHAYAVNLINELERNDRGFDFTFLVPPGPIAEIPTTNVRLCPVRLPGVHQKLRLAARLAYEELVLPVRALRFDLVYAIADIASPLLSVPTVVALRNLNIYDHTYDDRVRLRILLTLVRMGIRSATRMIFPSDAASRSIGERLDIPRERIRVVPHGVNSEAFDQFSGREGGAPFLFLPAAVERHKNIEVLVEAIPLFSDPELEIRIAGTSKTDPLYRVELLKRAQQLGVENRFHLLGPVPYERVVAYYRGAIALVFPSFLETFGHPMLEAMHTGTPIVASEIPAFREIADGIALFFPASDPAALARAVDQIVAEPTLTAERVSLGRERAGLYSWERSTDVLCSVFDEILVGARRSK